MIPGCIGKRVRLGSDSLSGTAAGRVWKSWNLEICEVGNLGTLKSRILGSTKSPKQEFSKPVLPKMSERSGLTLIVETKSSLPHLVPFQIIFSRAGKCRIRGNVGYFSWWANGPYSPGLGSSSYIWQGLYESMLMTSAPISGVTPESFSTDPWGQVHLRAF